MSDPELEEELRTLLPAAPPASLEAALARDLAPSRAVALRPAAGVVPRPGVRERWAWWPSLSWAVTGSLAILVFLLLPKPWNADRSATALAQAALFEPVESSPELLSAEGGEISYSGSGGPSQLVRYSSIERQTWANPTTGAQLEVETPREDVFLVPVSYQ